MINVYDIAYGLGVAIAAPIWATRKRSRDKVLTAFRERFGRMPRRAGDRLAVWIHAVSLGEVNAARALIEQLLSSRDDLDVIVSTTTTTGHERATSLYKRSQRICVVRYPLDFSAAIARALDALRPSAVVLMELETWPNFLRHCEQRGIPVVLANGRITNHSFSRYRLILPIVATMFRRLAAICVQDAEYAKRFAALGAPPDKITVTGTMKYDSAEIADTISGADELQRALRLDQTQPLWVCGSTGPGEESIVLCVYRRLLPSFPTLRLAIIPRHPQRFDEVATLIRDQAYALLRRSDTCLPLSVRGERAGERVPPPSIQSPVTPGKQDPLPEYKEREAAPTLLGATSFATRHSALGTSSPVLLGDTMGELRKFYSLATVVFVGRSLVDLGSRQHGSDMIEPAALAKPCIVGPFTGNFDLAVRALETADGLIEVSQETELEQALTRLLQDAASAEALGRRAQQVIREQQGATRLQAEIILRQLR